MKSPKTSLLPILLLLLSSQNLVLLALDNEVKDINQGSNHSSSSVAYPSTAHPLPPCKELGGSCLSLINGSGLSPLRVSPTLPVATSQATSGAIQQRGAQSDHHHGIKARKGVHQLPAPYSSLIPPLVAVIVENNSTEAGPDPNEAGNTLVIDVIPEPSNSSQTQFANSTETHLFRDLISTSLQNSSQQDYHESHVTAPVAAPITSTTSQMDLTTEVITERRTETTAATGTGSGPGIVTSSWMSINLPNNLSTRAYSPAMGGTSTSATDSGTRRDKEKDGTDARVNVQDEEAERRRHEKERELSRENYHILIGLCLGFLLMVYVLIHILVHVHGNWRRRQFPNMETRHLIDNLEEEP